MANLQELYRNIVQWSKDRKIIPNASVLVQAGKMISEKSEISKAFIESNYDELVDGIGDTFVTIVNVVELAKLKGLKGELDLSQNRSVEKSIANNILKLDVLMGEIIDLIIKERYNEILPKLNQSIQYLDRIAHLSNTTLEKCVEKAYNEIKDRKGITLENGTFVKESDPRYNEIVKKIESQKEKKNSDKDKK